MNSSIRKGKPVVEPQNSETAACVHYWVAQKKFGKGNITCSFTGKRGASSTKKVKAVVITELYVCQNCGEKKFYPVHLDHIYSEAVQVSILGMDLSGGEY